MRIGDPVICGGLSYVVIGFTPMSSTPAKVWLRDPRTAATVWAERRLVTAKEHREEAQAHLARDDSWQAQISREWDRQDRERSSSLERAFWLSSSGRGPKKRAAPGKGRSKGSAASNELPG